MNTSTVMTTRAFYTAVIEANINNELTTKAQELLAALDTKNEKRRSADSKEKKESAARRAAVLNFLTTHEGAFTRKDIAEATELTEGQVTSACTVLVKDGLLDKSEIKVEKTKKTAYSAKSAE